MYPFGGSSRADLKMRSRSQQTLLIAVVICIAGWLFFTSPLGTQPHRPEAPLQPNNDPPSAHKNPNTTPAFFEKPSSTAGAADSVTSDTTSDHDQKTDSKHESSTSISKTQQYIEAILHPEDTTFERMKCPVLPMTRYEDLKKTSEGKPRYFIALDLYEVEKLLPRLMGSIVDAVRYLGPENCAVSVTEGRSKDATYDILLSLKAELQNMGARFYLSQDNVDPHGEGIDRINALAELRNLALSPLIKHPSDFLSSTIIVFINDVALCAEDILELIYQHIDQSAAMTCAMDWIHDGDAFYDVWVSRTINSGNLFFNVPEDADWKYKGNLFFDDPPTKQKFKDLQPFEVYACWGGMVTLDPAPFIAGKIAFRRSDEGECYMGEPTLLGKDLWRLGIGRIATIPTVNVGYSNDETAKIKQRRGYVSEHIDLTQPPNNRQSERIVWSSKPPPMVKCEGIMWDDPSWVSPV